MPAGPEPAAGAAPAPRGRQRPMRRLERGVPRAQAAAGVPAHELTDGRRAGPRGELRSPRGAPMAATGARLPPLPFLLRLPEGVDDRRIHDKVEV